MTYDGMDVAEGTAAGLTFERLIKGLPHSEHKRLRQALIDYCKQDTLAMVRLLGALS